NVEELTRMKRSNSKDDSSPKPTKKYRIVLADDNADMREYVSSLLNRQYNLHVECDGEAALKAIEANPPDLVLSDIMMPKMNGFELLNALRSSERLKTIPVIFLSARAGEEAKVEGLQSGADGNEYCVKLLTM